MASGFFDNIFSESNLRQFGKKVRDAFSVGRFFSDQTKIVVQAAEQICIENKNRLLEPEHVLFSVLQHDVGQTIIAEFQISHNALAEHIIDAFLNPLPKTSMPGEVDLSPASKQLFESSLATAQEMGYPIVYPEHLLLAIAQDEEGNLSKMLRLYGITAHELRKKIVRKFGMGPAARKTATPQLDKYSRDLTLLAREGKLDPVIGRAEEIETTIEILARRKKNNPVLIGEPGVGKTAIVEGLAQRINSGNVPEVLRNKRIVELNVNALVSGSQFRGQFEERIQRILTEVFKSSHELILFVDEMHTLVGAGSSQESALDAANILKPALARGDLHLIGATTLYEYQKHIEKDAALERRLQPVIVPEPTLDQTKEILSGLRDRFEQHHKVVITDEAIRAAVDLSERYIPARHQPDKAIDVLDQSSASVRIAATSMPSWMQDLQATVDRLRTELVAAESRNMRDRVGQIRAKLQSEHAKLEQATSAWRTELQSNSVEVTWNDVAKVVSKLSGIPAVGLTETEKERLLNMEQLLSERVVGQPLAVSAVSNMVRIARAGLKRGKKPLAVLMFAGPSGVGKTELAKALAELLFGDEDALIRIDMSEYSEKHSVARLIGAPPGYIGHDEGGQLTEKVRRRPYCVVLLDEIDKAHSDAQNILLQMLDEGRLTDSKGRVVSFTNTIIVTTCNISTETAEIDLDDAHEMLRSMFSPELLNRIDEIVVFEPLSQEDVREIARKQLESVASTALDHGIIVYFDRSLVDWIADIGYQPQSGVRHLRNSIRSQVESVLALHLLRGTIAPGDSALLRWSAESKSVELLRTPPEQKQAS